MLLLVWDEMDANERFATAWQLLEEKERKRHLLKGLERAVSTGRGVRTHVCCVPKLQSPPCSNNEVRRSLIWLILVRLGRESSAGGDSYYLPSEWWAKAMEDAIPSLSVQITEFTCELLTFHGTDSYV
jgi:hypothetical protein